MASDELLALIRVTKALRGDQWRSLLAEDDRRLKTGYVSSWRPKDAPCFSSKTLHAGERLSRPCWHIKAQVLATESAWGLGREEGAVSMSWGWSLLTLSFARAPPAAVCSRTPGTLGCANPQPWGARPAFPFFPSVQAVPNTGSRRIVPGRSKGNSWGPANTGAGHAGTWRRHTAFCWPQRLHWGSLSWFPSAPPERDPGGGVTRDKAWVWSSHHLC